MFKYGTVFNWIGNSNATQIILFTMPHVKIKAFFGHKSGISDWEGADRISFNREKLRFAISDGITKSFLPSIWANLLCHSYTNSEEKPEKDWLNHYAETGLSLDVSHWEQLVKNIITSAPCNKVRILERMQTNYQYAGATLVGLSITNNELYYDVLGDSCLFFLNEATKQLDCISTINEKDGFTNFPDYISSEGKIMGEWKHGNHPLFNGYVLMMTDALSEWFLHQYQCRTSLIDQLWELNSHESFIDFVENARNAYILKDDDVALLMLKLEEYDENIVEIVYSDNLLEHLFPEWIEVACDGIANEQDLFKVSNLTGSISKETTVLDKKRKDQIVLGRKWKKGVKRFSFYLTSALVSLICFLNNLSYKRVLITIIKMMDNGNKK